MPKAAGSAYLPAFRQDIQDTIAWSEGRFGVAAAERYGLLIRQALRDVLDNPTRPGAKARPDLTPHAYVYHLAWRRDRVAGQRVNAPRHFVLYRYKGELVEFARLLHDSRDLARHVPAASEDSEEKPRLRIPRPEDPEKCHPEHGYSGWRVRVGMNSEEPVYEERTEGSAVWWLSLRNQGQLQILRYAQDDRVWEALLNGSTE